MAVIKEYSAPNPLGVITPSPGGEEAFARAGRTGEEMARQTGEALGGGITRLGTSIVTAAHGWARQADISSVGTNLTNYNTQMMQQYRQDSATWNPADTAAPQKFMDQYQEGLRKIADNVYASDSLEYSHGLANHFYGHMNDVIAADAATRGGNHILLGLNSSMRAAITAVGIDPSSAQSQITALESQFHAQVTANPELSPRIRGELQTAFVKARGQIGEQAMQVRATTNPGAFLKEVQSGHWDAVVPRALALQFGIKQERIMGDETRSQTYLNLALTRQHQETVASQLWAQGVKVDPHGTVTYDPSVLTKATNNAAEMGPFFAPFVRSYTSALSRQNAGETTVNDLHTLHAAEDGLSAGPGSPEFPSAFTLQKWGLDGHLSAYTVHRLLAMRQASVDSPGVRDAVRAGTQLTRLLAPSFGNPMTGIMTPAQRSGYTNWSLTTQEGFVHAYQTGGLPAMNAFAEQARKTVKNYVLGGLAATPGTPQSTETPPSTQEMDMLRSYNQIEGAYQSSAATKASRAKAIVQQMLEKAALQRAQDQPFLGGGG